MIDHKQYNFSRPESVGGISGVVIKLLIVASYAGLSTGQLFMIWRTKTISQSATIM